MATVVYSNEEDDMCSLVIDGEEYVEDEERAIIPKAVLKQIRVEDIPDNFQIEVCESKDSSVIMVSVPMTFVKVGKNEFQVIYDEIIYVFLTIFLYLLKCPQSLILSALRAFCFCGKPHISRSIFLYFRYQAWLKSW